MFENVADSKNEFIHIGSTKIIGFWIYLLSDCVLFLVLFATYALLYGNQAGGPDSHAIFHLNTILAETIFLLTSSFTCGLTLFFIQKTQRTQTYLALASTIILGLLFIVFEFQDFAQLISTGQGPAVSAFLSAYFTLVGTHGLHVLIGLIWAVFLFLQLMLQGMNDIITLRCLLFTLFWHFLDIIWIFIFTFVYLTGTL